MPQKVPVNGTAVLKTAVPLRVPRVRIPAHPLLKKYENAEKLGLVHSLVFRDEKALRAEFHSLLAAPLRPRFFTYS